MELAIRLQRSYFDTRCERQPIQLGTVNTIAGRVIVTNDGVVTWK